MAYKIHGYKPEAAFHYFEELSAIPRSSGNEEGICNFLIDFAKKHNLEYYTDELHNVVIKKPGSKGSEDKPAVMFQGHTDMVCEKNPGVDHDFEKDGIDMIVDDEKHTVTANGTTLGADNGIAVAMMLAILSDDSLVHPPLECVFTTSEETGMFGAQALDTSILKARTMINLDSEEEGIATVSCAGGLNVSWSKDCQWEAADAFQLQIEISGLLGGHSGTDIRLERTNANKLMGRFLYSLLTETGMRLISINGGTKDNAITRSCTAVVCFPTQEECTKAQSILEGMIADTKAEIHPAEPGYQAVVSNVSGNDKAMSRCVTEAVVKGIYLAPNGPQKRNLQAGGFIITSLNMGIVSTGEKEVEIRFSPRSSVDSLQQETKKTLLLLADLLGFKTQLSGEYQGWAYAEVSPIRDVFCDSYRRLFGRELKIEAIHAGLECGLFSGKMPGLDAIAVGPTMSGVHTPEETLYLDDCKKVWDLLVEVLKNLAK